MPHQADRIQHTPVLAVVQSQLQHLLLFLPESALPVPGLLHVLLLPCQLLPEQPVWQLTAQRLPAACIGTHQG